MEQEFNMTINELPAKTWNWLHMNDTQLENIQIPEEKPLTDEKWKADNEALPIFREIPSGMGKDMDALIRESGAVTRVYKTQAGEKIKDPVKLTLDYTESACEISAFGIWAGEDSEVTVIMDYTSQRSAAGQAVVQTKILAEKNAKVRLVQIERLGNKFTLLNDIGALCREGADVEVLQLVLGGENTYLGCKAELLGKGSQLSAETGYLVENDGVLDMNYVAEHRGQKTTSDMRAAGVLRDQAKKLYRGTIDFKKGAKGAVGNEKEDVLLLDEEVVNRTIPLILCAEEDVEGNHGATIGKLDDELLFYLETRGLTKEEVYEMMAQARIDEISRKIPDRETRKKIFEFQGRTFEAEEQV